MQRESRQRAKVEASSEAETASPDFIPFGAPCLGEEEIQEVIDTLRSGWIGMGPKVERFEEMFRSYVGSRHAIAVSSCTAALHLSVVGCGIGPGDEVITTPMTFAATASVVIHQGGRPVFVDIDPVTLNIDPSLLQERITKKTKAIIPVHFGGLPCAMEEIKAIADRHGLEIIEDAAHALGARYHGKIIGAGWGKTVCFSFYANKNITTAEGGMVTTEDDELAEKLESYRLHGLSRDAWQRFQTRKLLTADILAPGYKYNMTDLQASLGIHQLQKLESFLETREHYAQLYDDAFRGIPGLSLQPRPSGGGDRHGLHLYLLLLDLDQFRVDRDRIVEALRQEWNVGAAIHYKALHLHPYYQDTFGYGRGLFPRAERVSDSILSLPISPKMREDQVHYVARAVLRVLRENRR